MKKFVSIRFIAMFTIMLAIVSGSCVKQDFDEPPIRVIPVGEVLNIAQLRQIFADSGLYTFESDYSLYANVILNDATGNIYKSAYIQDSTGALNLHLNSSGGMNIGDNIRVYLKGCQLSTYEKLMQIDDVDIDDNIIIISTDNYIEPRTVTIAELNNSMNNEDFAEYESQLIKLEGVQFSDNEIGKRYADVETNDYGNRSLEDCEENSTIVRTSDYAGFAEEYLPQGNGSMIAIAGRYREDIQLIIRSTYEVVMEGTRCGADTVLAIYEDFSGEENNQDITISGWKNKAVVGDRAWQGKEYSGNVYAQATSYNSEEDNECWMITVPIDLNNMASPMARFETAQAYWEHDGLTVLFSTDFDGFDISSANWQVLNCRIANQNDPEHDWIESGEIALPTSGIGYLAFKYTGSDLNGNTTSYRVDNVEVWDAGK